MTIFLDILLVITSLALMALILLQVISSAFNLLDFSPFLTLAIWGALIIVVTALGVVLENFGALRR